jgi:hypothetical protein
MGSGEHDVDPVEEAALALVQLARRIRDGRDLESVDGLLEVLRSTRELRGLEVALTGSVVAVLRRHDTSWVEIGSSLGLTRQSAWDRYHAAEATFTAREGLLFAALARADPMPYPDLVEGHVYTRVELQRLFSIRDATLKNGVFQIKDRNEIWLFVTAAKQSDRVQYEDRLEGDTLYWQGQTSGRTDERIIRHVDEGNDLLLFFRESKSQYPGAGFEFIGKLIYISHEGPAPTHFVLKRRVAKATLPKAL